jgi:hypothetical protein
MVVDTFRTVLPNLASKISLRDPENKTNPPAERGMFSYEPPPKREPPVDGMLLASLLSHTLFSLNLQPETFDLMESIRKEVNHIHSDDFHGMIFPFLHGLLTALMVRNISPTSAEYGSRFPRFFRSVIRRYLALYVRPEPKRPKNWTRDPVPSHCDDCNWLSCFLQDPNAMTGKFPCAVKRRRHLEGRIGDVSRRGEYNLETDHNGNSLTLIITKTEKKWEREWAEWEKRCCEAHKKIDELFKLVPKSELVGNDFDISPTRLPSGINDHGAPEQPVVQRMYAPHFDPIVSTNPKFRRQGWRGNADVAEHYAHEYYASRPARHIPIGPGPEPPRNQQPALSMREISQRISRQFRTAASTRITPLAPNSTNKATSPRGTKRKIETVDLTDD